MTKIKESNKKDQRRKKLLLLILLLVVSVICLSAGTYAWFTSNKRVNVSDINVDVRAVNGLEISADGVNWGVKVSKDDLIETPEYTTQKNQLPDSLGAVSSVKELTDAKLLKLFDGSVATNCPGGGTDCDDPTYTLTTTEASEKRCYDSDGNGGENVSAVPDCSGQRLVAFDIFLKVDRDDTVLYLTENAGVFNTSMDDLGIKNTTRVAFIVQGNMDSDTYRTSDTAIQDVQALQNGEQVILWEPNFDAHTQAGVTAAKTFYGIEGLTPGNGNSLQAYEGVSNVITQPIPLTETNSTQHAGFFKAVTPDITSPAEGAVRQSTKITLKNGVTKLRVYFWVEGQDVDAENNATGSDMKLSLEFAID